MDGFPTVKCVLSKTNIASLFPERAHVLKENADNISKNFLKLYPNFHERVTHTGEEVGILTRMHHSSLII